MEKWMEGGMDGWVDGWMGAKPYKHNGTRSVLKKIK